MMAGIHSGEVAYATPFAFNPGALTCGADPGSPVTTDYKGPFRFTGTIHTAQRSTRTSLVSQPALAVHPGW